MFAAWGAGRAVMKGLVRGTVAALVASMSAHPAGAEELVYGLSRPAAPIYNPYGFYNWSGFYLGLNGGGHWSTDTNSSFISANAFWTPANVTIMTAALPLTANQTGFAGGGQAGFNWHISSFVVGIEADITELSGTATRNVRVPWTVPSQQATLTDSVSDRWMATFRARGGYAFDRLLIYVTAGSAAANWSITHTYADNFLAGTPSSIDQVSQTRFGWTAGGGIEYALGSSFIVRAEYLYASLSGLSSALTFQNTPGRGATLTYSDGLTESIARAAISYKFGR
jgi:outer membrane immunogenic protein